MRPAPDQCILAVMDPDRGNSADPGLAPEYSPSGVDLSLIRWMLTLTPAERLEFLQDRIEEINRIRDRNATT